MCVSIWVCEGGRRRELVDRAQSSNRERDRERERKRERDTQRDRERDTQRETHRETEKAKTKRINAFHSRALIWGKETNKQSEQKQRES